MRKLKLNLEDIKVKPFLLNVKDNSEKIISLSDFKISKKLTPIYLNVDTLTLTFNNVNNKDDEIVVNKHHEDIIGFLSSVYFGSELENMKLKPLKVSDSVLEKILIIKILRKDRDKNRELFYLNMEYFYKRWLDNYRMTKEEFYYLAKVFYNNIIRRSNETLKFYKDLTVRERRCLVHYYLTYLLIPRSLVLY